MGASGGIDGSSTSTTYREVGAVRLDGLVALPVAEFLANYSRLLAHNGRMFNASPQVPGSLEVYGDAAFDALLGGLTHAVSCAVDRKLIPTYSFVRLYQRGQVLSVHSDRPACEHSATVHLASSSPEPWPVSYRDLLGVDQHVDLGVGDALVYQGCAVAHWRGPCPVEWYLQAFLHYVDEEGPYRDQCYDGRSFLGVPRVETRVAGDR